MWAVIGLGNPGRRYSRTRHNVGFDFIKGIAKSQGVLIRKRRYVSKVGEAGFSATRALLVLPQTYMNASGLAAKALVEQAGISSRHMIVVFDDFDLSLGEIRIRKKGSGGSHKGMGSIIREVGSSDIPRIRIGIGPLPAGADPVEFVLSPFSGGERQELDKTLVRTAQALEMILTEQIDKAMSRFNALHPPPL